MPERGLEPPRLAASGPKPDVYANFTTPALKNFDQRLTNSLTRKNSTGLLTAIEKLGLEAM